MLWDGTRLEVGASIGAAILNPRQSRAASGVFAEADAALYAAKAAGRNAVRIYGDPSWEARIPGRVPEAAATSERAPRRARTGG
ncbi:diguanylate cyclase domain-containing protein [Methylorubrum aminovorans]|nr:diguanylate cyclase [Methylorubrum aminovorans]